MSLSLPYNQNPKATLLQNIHRIQAFWVNCGIPSAIYDRVIGHLLADDLVATTTSGSNVPKPYYDEIISTYWITFVQKALANSLRYGYYIFTMLTMKLPGRDTVLVPYVVNELECIIVPRTEGGWKPRIIGGVLHRRNMKSKSKLPLHVVILTEPLLDGTLTSRSRRALDYYIKLESILRSELVAARLGCIPTCYNIRHTIKTGGAFQLEQDDVLRRQMEEFKDRTKIPPVFDPDTGLLSRLGEIEPEVQIVTDKLPDDSTLHFAPAPQLNHNLIALVTNLEDNIRSCMGISAELRVSVQQTNHVVATDNRETQIRLIIQEFRRPLQEGLRLACLVHRNASSKKAGKKYMPELRVSLPVKMSRDDLYYILPHLTDKARAELLATSFNLSPSDIGPNPDRPTVDSK